MPIDARDSSQCMIILIVLAVDRMVFVFVFLVWRRPQDVLDQVHL